MALAKTVKGREALKSQGELTRYERGVLILCDSKRGLFELVQMLGDKALDAVASLQYRGYLVNVSDNLQKVAEFSDTGTIEFSLTKPAQDAQFEGLSYYDAIMEMKNQAQKARELRERLAKLHVKIKA